MNQRSQQSCAPLQLHCTAVHHDKERKGGEEGKQMMRKERVYYMLYCLHTLVAPTMVTNPCYFSQVQAEEGKTSCGGNQRLSLPSLEKRGRAEVSRWVI